MASGYLRSVFRLFSWYWLKISNPDRADREDQGRRSSSDVLRWTAGCYVQASALDILRLDRKSSCRSLLCLLAWPVLIFLRPILLSDLEAGWARNVEVHAKLLQSCATKQGFSIPPLHTECVYRLILSLVLSHCWRYSSYLLSAPFWVPRAHEVPCTKNRSLLESWSIIEFVNNTFQKTT